MHQSIWVDHKRMLLQFDLSLLKASFSLEALQSLEITPTEKLLSFKQCGDPKKPEENVNIQTLISLSTIHEKIVSVALEFNASQHELNNESRLDFCKWSTKALLTAFSLSTIFHLYFRLYDLDNETWSCQDAWMHLLRLRYHTIMILYERRNNDDTIKAQAQWLDANLAPALRDWINFCTNTDNHFLFAPEDRKHIHTLGVTQEADSVPEVRIASLEDEVLLITRPSRSAPSYDFYLNHSGGRQRLDRLIAEWFLPDRYDCLGAIGLAWRRAATWCGTQSWPKPLGIIGGVIGTVIGVFVVAWFLAEVWLRWDPGDMRVVQALLVQALLVCVYLFLLFFGVLSFFWRTAMDVLLPRLWAGIVVGYLPLLTTPELWKVACNGAWWGSQGYGIVFLNAMAVFVAFLYLRWEVGNRLVRTRVSTPGWRRRIVGWRACYVTVWGWLVATTLGLVILHIAGKPMAHASWGGTSPPTGVAVLGGEVHFPVLFLFAPCAMLIGVIVQIFWEEKSVTHPA